MKYILYKTTNLVNNYIYIGVHKTKDPEIFDNYLGCGVYTNKPYSYEKAKTCFLQAVKQYGIKNFKRETLSIYDTAEEAYSAEALVVNELFLSRSDVYNMILGGNINWELGKPVYQYDSLTGEFIREYKSCKEASDLLGCNSASISHGIIHRFKILGYCFSYEKQDIINLEMYNFKCRCKVYRYLKSGEFDLAFDSYFDAGKNSLDTSSAYIQKSAILGYLVKDTYYFSPYKFNKFDEARTFQIKNRQVFQYDLFGNFVKEYLTQSEAEFENPGCNITKCVKFRTKDNNGSFWALQKVKLYNVPKKRESKKVAKIDDDGNILLIWNSVNLCAKEVGTSVKNVLLLKYNRHNGYKYIYYN